MLIGSWPEDIIKLIVAGGGIETFHATLVENKHVIPRRVSTDDLCGLGDNKGHTTSAEIHLDALGGGIGVCGGRVRGSRTVGRRIGGIGRIGVRGGRDVDIEHEGDGVGRVERELAVRGVAGRINVLLDTGIGQLHEEGVEARRGQTQRHRSSAFPTADINIETVA